MLSLSLPPPSLSLIAYPSFAPFIALSLSISVRPPFSNLLSRPLCLTSLPHLLPRPPFQPLDVALLRASVSFSLFSSIPSLFHPLLRCVPNDNAKTSWLKIPRGSPDEAFPRSLGRWRAGADAARRTARESEREGPYVSCQECPSRSNPPPEGQRRRRAAVIDACILGLSTINIYVLSRDAVAQKRNAAAE